jgi:hypothetical protein
MLNQLFTLVQEEAQQEILDNPAIPNEQKNHAIGLVTDSIFGGLQKMLAQDKLGDVMGMFAGKKAAQKNIGEPIIENLVQGLMTKFALEAKSAQAIASSLIPRILNKISLKLNNPSDTTFDMNGIIGSLIGGETAQGSPVSMPSLPEQQAKCIDFNTLLQSLKTTNQDKHQEEQLSMIDLSGLISDIQKDKTNSAGDGDVLHEMTEPLMPG